MGVEINYPLKDREEDYKVIRFRPRSEVLIANAIFDQGKIWFAEHVVPYGLMATCKQNAANLRGWLAYALKKLPATDQAYRWSLPKACLQPAIVIIKPAQFSLFRRSHAITLKIIALISTRLIRPPIQPVRIDAQIPIRLSTLMLLIGDETTGRQL